MSRLIDADLFFEELRKTKPDKWVDYGSIGYSKELIKEVLDKTPTVDAVPVVHAHWIMKNDLFGTKYECSECGHCDSKSTAVRGHYCWFCGAKMDGERKDNG